VPFYAGTSLQLLQRDVAELSLQTHELGVSLLYAPSYRTRLLLSPSILASFIGQSDPQAFSLEPGAAGRFEMQHGKRWSTRISTDVRRLDGLNGRDALDGSRFELGIRESLRVERLVPWLELVAGQNGMGVTEQYTTPDDFSFCSNLLHKAAGPCRKGGLYRIPLGYRSVAGSLGANVELGDRLSLSGSVKLEYRRYLRNSVLVLKPLADAPRSGRTASGARTCVRP